MDELQEENFSTKRKRGVKNCFPDRGGTRIDRQVYASPSGSSIDSTVNDNKDGKDSSETHPRLYVHFKGNKTGQKINDNTLGMSEFQDGHLDIDGWHCTGDSDDDDSDIWEAFSSNTNPGESDSDEDHLGLPNDVDDLVLDPENFRVLLERFWRQRDQQELEEEEARPAPPLYPQGPLITAECFVCFEETKLRRRLCCSFPVCDPCLESYLTVQVSQATVKIECINSNCQSYVHRDEILTRLPPRMKSKFYKFLIDANLDPCLKTCPRCSDAVQLDRTLLKKRNIVKKGLPVVCPRCHLEWCFSCHAPWHKGLTCKEYRKGDHLLKDWAREFHYGQINAQKCPKCKIYIQRSIGCDHMTCNRCGTSFCYRCGKRYLGIKLLGNHFSRLSPFGCRYNFMPDAPHTRRLIRGTVFSGKLLGGLALSACVVAAGAVLLGLSVIVLPAYGGFKLHKFRQQRKRMKAFRKRTQARQQNPFVGRSVSYAYPMATTELKVEASGSAEPEENSDESSDRNEQVIIGLELPDSQRVEVLVHRTVGSSGEQEDKGTSGSGEVVTESSVIVTDIKEVKDENGYTTVITHIYAKPLEKNEVEARHKAGVDQNEEVAKEENTEDSEDGEEYHQPSAANATKKDGYQRTSTAPKDVADFRGNENQNKNVMSGKEEGAEEKEKNRNDVKSLPSTLTTKETPGKNADGEKNVEGWIQRLTAVHSAYSKDKKDKEKEKETSVDVENADQSSPSQLTKEDTNGCFGNIFAKKLTVLQLSNNNHSSSDIPTNRQRVLWRHKSATWEKSSKNGNHKHVGTQGTRHVEEDLCKSPLPSDNTKGVLLQDCLDLTAPGCDRGSSITADESLSVSSLSLSLDDTNAPESMYPRKGEQESGSCLSRSCSFHGSTLSCDVVTYI